MRYQQKVQRALHEATPPVWDQLITLIRDGAGAQIRGIYLVQSPGADEGIFEVPYLDDFADALAVPGEVIIDLEAALERVHDQVRAGRLAVDTENLVGLAVSAHDETDEWITIHGAFTDGTCHETIASPEGTPSSRVIFPADSEALDPIAAALLDLLDTVIGDQHDHVTRALHDALDLCLHNGFNAAIGIWEQDPGVFQARPYPDLGQSLAKATYGGTDLTTALKHAARERQRHGRPAKRPPVGFGWIRHDGLAQVTGIAVLGGWIYSGTLYSGQDEPTWTIFPAATSGNSEREFLGALQQLLNALRGQRPQSMRRRPRRVD